MAIVLFSAVMSQYDFFYCIVYTVCINVMFMYVCMHVFVLCQSSHCHWLPVIKSCLQ